MRGKVAAVWISLLIMVSSLVILVEIAEKVEAPTTLYVGGAGPGNYSKIQDAIDSASSGDTVFVYNGTYYENVIVNKTINLTGEGRDSTTINGSGSGIIIEVSVNFVNITGFTVTRSGLGDWDAGIKLNHTQNCKIYNNVLSNNKFGIFLNYSNENYITDNIVSNNGRGLFLYFSDSVSITENNATNNGYGFFIMLSNRNIIIKNNASNNLRGIDLYQSDGNNMTGNTASSNNRYSIILRSSNGNNITNNNASNNNRGIYLDSSNGNNITKNEASSNNEYGIYLETSNGNHIKNNNASYNRQDGIYIMQSIDTDVMGNNASSNGWSGIHFEITMENNIINNTASFNNQFGIYIHFSRECKILGNFMENDGIFIYSTLLEQWNSHIIDTTNSVNGKPTYYWKNQNGGWIPPGAGEVILANCSNISVNDQDFDNTSVGVLLGYSTNNNITNNSIVNNMYGTFLYSSDANWLSENIVIKTGTGMHIEESSYNNLSSNNLSQNNYGAYLYNSDLNNINSNNLSWNKYFGAHLAYSNWNNLSKNNVSNNSGGFNLWFAENNNLVDNLLSPNNGRGIYFFYGKKNIIQGNNISSNVDGIFLDVYSDNNYIKSNDIFSNDDRGIYIETTSDNEIIQNEIHNNRVGIQMYMNSASNEIIANNISVNEWGISILWASGNLLYHNNFINNTNHSSDAVVNSNKWDNGYPQGGNYWDDYSGVDIYHGPNQDQIGSDGIGDTEYPVRGGDSIDYYPLMAPFKPLENYTILKQGWNLISIPLIQGEQNLSRVLSYINGWYDAVQWYDKTDPNDPWKHYKIGKPFGNDLSELNETMSFWIHISQPGDTIFVYNGTAPTSNQTIQLYKGWNMVGYPSLTSHNRTTGLNNLTFDTHVDAIQWYDAAARSWHFMGPDDSFVPGRGYWVHSKVDAVWEIPI
jgi:parallel beta-helix repeat protein